MNAQKIALLTDTGTNTPASFIAEHDIRVAPLQITYSDGTSYRSGIDITPAQLIERFKDEIPKTSLPTPQYIRDLFEQARADGYERAVFVTLSSGLSATNQTVKLVASQMENFPVVVVDSLSIGVAAGMVVIAAAEMIEAGVPFRSLQRKLDDLAATTRVYFSTKTLEYLRKGGRISEPVYRLGSMLNIKPVIMCNETGHYVVARKARGWERSLETEVRLAQEHAQKFKKVLENLANSQNAQLQGEAMLFQSQIDTLIDILQTDDAEAYQLRGTLRMKRGNKTGALDDMRKALDLNPDLLTHLSGEFQSGKSNC